MTIDADTHLAFAQGGALWSDFNKATVERGFVGVSGTADHTGIGGLITGGGYGFLTGQYGLTIDNLVEVTMVVADGRIVKASETENSDLFWAVRGANFSFRKLILRRWFILWCCIRICCSDLSPSRNVFWWFHGLDS